jgi:hypothetical protein
MARVSEPLVEVQRVRSLERVEAREHALPFAVRPVRIQLPRRLLSCFAQLSSRSSLPL